MSFIRFSPWQDAAAYGQGLGQALSQALLQVPQIRQQNTLQQQLMGLRQAEFEQQQQLHPLQMQLMQGQIDKQQSGIVNDKAQSELYQAEAERQRANATYDRSRSRKLLEDQIQSKADSAMAGVLTRKFISGQDLTPVEGLMAGKLALKNPQFGALLRQQLAQKMKTKSAVRPTVLNPGDVVGMMDNGQFQPSFTNTVSRPPNLAELKGVLEFPGMLGGTNSQAYHNAQNLLQQHMSIGQPQQPSAIPQPQPITATNPQTGEKIQFVNGQWIPLQ